MRWTLARPDSAGLSLDSLSRAQGIRSEYHRRSLARMREQQVSLVLADRYELRARIGSGGMATVWRALDRRLGREVAVKVLSEALATDETFRRRFEREAHHVASLAHPHIVVVHDFGSDGDRLFIVMELVPGQSLRQVLAGPSPLLPAQVRQMATDVLSGLAHAHGAGIIHRDIKPANILITDAGVS